MRRAAALVSLERRILRLLHNHKTRHHLREIHSQILRHNLHNSNLILSHFISICTSQNQINHASLIFNQTQNPNILSYNSIIKAHSLHYPYHQALCLFKSLKGKGICPDEFTFAPLLKACGNIGDGRVGECVHCDVLKNGYEGFGKVGIGVVEFYVQCGRVSDARKVFDEMSEREVIVWNLLMKGYCKVGAVDMGLGVFRKMGERSVVSWNTMIGGLAGSGRDGEALGLFREMRDQGVEMDEATVVTVLPVCARTREVDVGKWVHSYAESKGLFREFVSVGNALVDFYCKGGVLEGARSVFNEMLRKNVVSWNAMISGLAFNGKGEDGVKLFDEMIDSGVEPTDATFVGVLACCVHAGLVEKGRELFASMTEKYQIEPKSEHFGCMVDLLGRSGHVREAYELIRSMPMMPNAALWGSLLSACRNQGDVKLAEVAVKELINLEPWNSGNYVLLSNIYAEQGRWDGVENVRMLMRENCVKKAGGQSAVG